MDNMTFTQIKTRIKNDRGTQAGSWYDGTKWTDPSGNWYGWTDCGVVEHLFYAGTEWTRRTLADGKLTEPEEVKRYNPAAERPLCEHLGDSPNCGGCIFEFCYGCGADAECPVMDRDEMIETLELLEEKSREALRRLGA